MTKASSLQMAFSGAALFVALAVAGTARATEVGIERPIGVGLVAGSAPGLTMKIWTRPTNALDLGFGFGTGQFACSDRFNPCGQRTSFNLDYLYQGGHGRYDLVGVHVGLGARFWLWDYGSGNGDFQVAGRIPIGLDIYAFRWLEAYAEVTPSYAFSPNLFFFEGAIGARIYL